MGIGIERPAWTKIMENGAAGEARTKAFLLERFGFWNARWTWMGPTS
jgi:hypothetical protein